MNTGGLDPKQVQAWRELEDLTRQMREAQSEYFKTRSNAALAHSKMLERRVDAKLLSLRTLFGEPEPETGNAASQEALL